MEFTTSWNGQVAVAHIQGNVDTESAQPLAKELAGVIAKRPKGLVFDLAQVHVLTLAGLAVLVKAGREVRQLGGDAVCAAPEAPVAKILDAEKATHGLAVEPTVCLAVTNLLAKNEWVRV